MSNATKPTRIEKTQKQIATRLKKVEKALPAAWEAATSVGYTPEALEKKSNWRFEGTPEYVAMHTLSGDARSAIYSYYSLADDLRRSLSDLQDALFCEAKRVAAAAKKAEKEESEKGLRMTCQICGRGILSNTGAVAHHGYERPGMGYQTESCDGARCLPIEADTSALEAHIPGQIRTLNYYKEELDNIINERVCIVRSYTKGYGNNKETFTVVFTREDFAEKVKGIEYDLGIGYGTTFDTIKGYVVEAQERKVQGQQEYIDWQQGRLAAAKKAGVTHVFDAERGVWVNK